MAGKDTTRVDIEMKGSGLSGTFSSENMDPRLAPFLTEQMYQEGLEAINESMKKRKGSTFVISMILFAVILVVGGGGGGIFTLRKAASNECAAPNGACADGVTAADGQCCSWHCCGDEKINDKDIDYSIVFADYPEDQCTRIPSTGERNCECEAEMQGTNEIQKCKAVKLDGEIKIIPEENAWAFPVGVIMIVIAGLLLFGCVGHLGVKVAGTSGVVCECLDPWIKKGLNVCFKEKGDAKDKNAGPEAKAGPRIIVIIPKGATAQAVYVPTVPPPVKVGSTGQTMQVQVAEGAVPGTTIEVQTPTGKTIQIQVPAGAQPGSVITVPY